MDENQRKIISAIDLDIPIPPPSPGPIYTEISLKHDMRKMKPPKASNTIFDLSVLQMLDLDLVQLTHDEFEKEEKKPVIVSKHITLPNINTEAVVKDQSKLTKLTRSRLSRKAYDEVLRDSFILIDEDPEFKHPIDENIEMEAVYEVFPCSKLSKYNFMAVNGETEDLTEDTIIQVTESNTKTPQAIQINSKTYDVQPLNMDEFLYIYFEDGKAYYRQIGANLRIKEKKIPPQKKLVEALSQNNNDEKGKEIENRSVNMEKSESSDDENVASE
ncbi:hypothetical protein EDEG_01064 [Edhazardia aedis USNM 41457]|uniref:Uncharacterized protein n=1 Tax=Edhazardia aedis (strain USNM 41457) TaxID=1003232 RepID=J9DBA6_EDHAE|nr:hypothetical protein EDEG_01064 [Edhazardia aedis USNM 41457]|eukprot:EJW04774.1 hypothetical protein EDEG_01064 [Edhazardia aedis USNM 41457]